jgi:hypothetical protein
MEQTKRQWENNIDDYNKKKKLTVGLNKYVTIKDLSFFSLET